MSECLICGNEGTTASFCDKHWEEKLWNKANERTARKEGAKQELEKLREECYSHQFCKVVHKVRTGKEDIEDYTCLDMVIDKIEKKLKELE